MLLGNLRQCGGRLTEAERLTALAVDQLQWRDGLGLLGVALGYRANAIAKQGRTTEAQAVLDAMTAPQRTARHAHIQVAEAEAWILAHSGDLEGAVDVIEHAVDRGRDAVFLAALAACIPIRLGFPQRAAEMLEFLMEHSHTELELMLLRVSADVEEAPFQRTPPQLLTPRELEVARAAAARERSREIAERLGTSPRTVETQLLSVYRKLGVSSRDDLRDALADVGLDEDERIA